MRCSDAVLIKAVQGELLPDSAETDEVVLNTGQVRPAAERYMYKDARSL